MSVRIITDSASDISQELAKEWNITVLPLKVRFGEEEFLERLRVARKEKNDDWNGYRHFINGLKLPMAF